MTWKLALAALAIGIVGCLLALGGYHLYLDHAKLHLIDEQVGVWQAGARQQQAIQQGAGK